jgi:dipeptidase D
MDIAELDPVVVWEHFAVLCRIPRPSLHEQAVRDHLKDWALQLGLDTRVDATGNLIIKKPATPGMEKAKGVILQGHLDMVCQANSGTAHDFTRDPIRPVLKDGWLIAEETTLGADNGIGVAMAMAVLSSKDLVHGPVEALFTLDEEEGMSGARGLEPGLLSGEYMINLDTECWGEFFIGCAGGIDVNVRRAYRSEAIPSDMTVCRLSLTGLEGGHSGADIHLGRGNANKILVRLLNELAAVSEIRLSSYKGGNVRNAITREAFAIVAIPTKDMARIESELDRFQQVMRQELKGIDDGITVKIDAARADTVMARADQLAILRALHVTPYGVKALSCRVPGVVETSNNLGVVEINDGKLSAVMLVRSLIDSGMLALAEEIRSLYRLIDADVEFENGYPGWAPNPDSSLLTLCQKVFKQEFNADSTVKVIHAGLECGLLGSKYPRMDMVSFGPNIRGAHAPGERLEVASVGSAWTLLKSILAQVPA